MCTHRFIPASNQSVTIEVRQHHYLLEICNISFIYYVKAFNLLAFLIFTTRTLYSKYFLYKYSSI